MTDRPRARQTERPPLKPTVFLVLVSLASAERHGYAIKKDVAARTRNSVRLGPATLYRTLSALLDEGLIEESERRPAPQLDDERRRYYRLTERGRRVMMTEARRLEELASAARAAVLESKA